MARRTKAPTKRQRTRIPTERQSKYGNRKTELDGITFDSAKEARRYLELKMLEEAGIISDLKLQVPFVLQPAYYKDGKRIQAIKYIADFTYIENGEFIIEDVKSPATRKKDVYVLKKKIMEYQGNYIKET